MILPYKNKKKIGVIMKVTALEISSSYNGVKKLKWDEIYESEDELINDLRRINLDVNIVLLPRGYEYMSSFKKQLENEKELSSKQMTQLKRIACCVAYGIYVNKLIKE